MEQGSLNPPRRGVCLTQVSTLRGLTVTMSSESIRIYFSFRSPYSCLGLYRFSRLLEQMSLNYELIPLVPPDEFIQQQQTSPDKRAYLIEDIQRYFTAYGLPVIMPQPFDVNWAIPHAAFVVADQYDMGLKFAVTLSLRRFSQGQDIASVAVLSEVAGELDLPVEEILQAHTVRSIQRALLQARRSMQEDRVFGVPTFVYQNQRYWGNDRLEWLIRNIHLEQGNTPSDLANDPLAPV